MARPGESMVRTVAREFMRQYCTDSGHPFVHDAMAIGRFEINGVDILPAIAAAMAAAGAVPEPPKPAVINNDGSPYRQYSGFGRSSAWEAMQRAAREHQRRG